MANDNEQGRTDCTLAREGLHMSTDEMGQQRSQGVQPARLATRVDVAAEEPAASLYDMVGGAAVVTAAVEELYQRALANPNLAAHFAHASVTQLKEHQRVFLTWLLGGPDDASGYSLREAHTGRGITDADFDRIVQHLVDTLTNLGVAPPLVERIIAVVEVQRAEIVGT
jgi:hemoglobin